MQERYKKNINALSAEEVELLHTKKVCIVGSGGLGGYILENLARIGVLNITIVDYDVFDLSNLNRQLLSSESVIGTPKVETAVKRIADVNSQVAVSAINARLDESNAESIVVGHDIIMDALDSVSARLFLADICRKLSIPMIHGSIAGWYGQVATIFPGDKTLQKIFSNVKNDKGIETFFSNLPFTAAVVASMQCAECIKVLLCRGDTISGGILHIDLLNNVYSHIKIN